MINNLPLLYQSILNYLHHHHDILLILVWIFKHGMMYHAGRGKMRECMVLKGTPKLSGGVIGVLEWDLMMEKDHHVHLY